MDPLRQRVYNAMMRVEEPDLKRDLVTLGMVKDIEHPPAPAGQEMADTGLIRVTIALTTPACPLKEVIRARCIEALEGEFGAYHGFTFEINLTAEVTAGRRAEGPLLPGVRNIVAIASGKGGVGKSTVTSNLAVALARAGARVGLIDADISGPSIPTMFGAELAYPGLRQDEASGRNVIIPVERHGVRMLSIGFLAPSQEAVVWRGPMMSSALRQFISDADWGELDYLLFDMPPGTSDIHLTLVQTVPVTGALVVTTPQKVALADARKAVSMFRQAQINVPVLGVVENMSYFEPADMPGRRYHLFGQGGGQALADEFDLPLLGQLPLVEQVRRAADDGLPAAALDGPEAAPYQQLAETLARQIAIVNAGLPYKALPLEPATVL